MDLGGQRCPRIMCVGCACACVCACVSLTGEDTVRRPKRVLTRKGTLMDLEFGLSSLQNNSVV